MNKLFLSNLLYTTPHVFINNKTYRAKNNHLIIPDCFLYFVALHIKLSTATYSSQLVELFAYENPTVSINTAKSSTTPTTLNTTCVYQFHNLFNQERLFVFSVPSAKDAPMSGKSIAELFANAWWLERELSELHGLYFEGKKDLRNLMLTYGDSSAPFRKSFPSIGVKEVHYDSFTDQISYLPVSIQA